MSVTTDQALAFINSSDAVTTDVLIQQATTLISDRLGVRGMQRISDEVFDYCVLQIVGELSRRRSAPGANLQWGPDGAVTYVSTDVLAPVMSVLRPYLGFKAVG